MAEDFRHMQKVDTDNDVRVYASDWNGTTKIHARKFVDTPKYSGPTKQGIAVPVEDVPALVQALLDVYAEETGVRFAVAEMMSED